MPAIGARSVAFGTGECGKFRWILVFTSIAEVLGLIEDCFFALYSRNDLDSSLGDVCIDEFRGKGSVHAKPNATRKEISDIRIQLIRQLLHSLSNFIF